MLSNRIKHTYFLPPQGTNRIWSRSEVSEINLIILNENGVEREITETELEEVKKEQHKLYCKLYPKLCLNLDDKK